MYESILESLFDGVYYVDKEKRITFWNKAAERITGFTKSEVIGHRCADNILRHIDEKGKELCCDGCPVTEALQSGKAQTADVYLHHKQGHRVPVSVRISSVRDALGNVVGGVEIFSDNSSYRQIISEMEKLKQESFLDELTKVGNRRYSDMNLQTRLYEFNTFGKPFGVILMDVDHFKKFNDEYGHKTGDAVLVMIGKTVSNLLRRQDTLSRWGGEEFVVLLAQVNPEVLHEVAERIRLFVEKSFIMEKDEKLVVTVSVGATLAQPGDTAESIFKRADALMYESKNKGRNRVTFG